MTQRQRQLVLGEILRHEAIAKICSGEAMKRGHLEVAEALTAALLSAEGSDSAWTISNRRTLSLCSFGVYGRKVWGVARQEGTSPAGDRAHYIHQSSASVFCGVL